MKAIISDIHGNLEALCAVLHDIEKQQVKHVICLGDIVGYGASPEECTDIVMEKAELSILGNHDFALIHGPLGFNSIAAEIIKLTRERMNPKHNLNTPEVETMSNYFRCAEQGNTAACMVLCKSKEARWKYIENLSALKEDKNGQILYVHGSPAEPTFEYVFPDNYARGWAPIRLQVLFSSISWLAFCGHTHLPCAITNDFRCFYPSNSATSLRLSSSQKYIINVGSVGQPRDGDPRACYLLFDEEKHQVQWQRVEYDIESAIKKIDAMCGTNSFCGLRLRYGK